MSNKKFSEFTLQTDSSNVAFVVGFNGSDNVRISPSNLIGSGFLPTSGGTMTGNLLLQDNIQVQIGTGADLKLYHNGTDSFIENQTGILKIQSSLTDGDISFIADNGSGGTTEYFRLDGSSRYNIFSKDLYLPDNVTIRIGTGQDLRIFHNGTNSFIEAYTGNLIIQNHNDDADVILKSDDGSGGVTEYFRLDGGTTSMVASKNITFLDGLRATFGSGADMQIYHNSTNTLIENNTGNLEIINNTDDSDIIFKSDDGSGGVTTYFLLDGSQAQTRFEKSAQFGDNIKAKFGSAGDMELYHDGSHSYVKQGGTGDLYIQQFRDDGDIVFQSDDGSGGVTSYFELDGSDVVTKFRKNLYLLDNVGLKIGNSFDLDIKHDGSDSFIANATGHLYIKNSADDKDIIFQSDDGSGGVTTYMFLDGSNAFTQVLKDFYFLDNVKARFGDNGDFTIHHNTNTFLKNVTNNLIIENTEDDANIQFKCDDGSGGTTEYFRVDGGATETVFSKDLRIIDNEKLILGTSNDLELFHNGTNTVFNGYNGNLEITNFADDKDIVFKSDDGSGGVTEYFRLDGGSTKSVFSQNAQFNDNARLLLGSGGDFQAYHDGTDTQYRNFTGDLLIKQEADDKDIIFKSDDGSGGLTTYFFLDGSRADGTYLYTEFPDNSVIGLGNDTDLQIYHSGTNSLIDNFVGDLIIQQKADDKDILFKCDDGSGGVATYMTIDGGATKVTLQKDLRADDGVKIQAGSSGDLFMVHESSTGKITNGTGNLEIIQNTDDGDILFKSDDGSGSVTTYFKLDGSIADGTYRYTKWEDYSVVSLGSGNDFQLFHDSTKSRVENLTGNLEITQKADDADIIFNCDDGSGGTTEYFRVDGGENRIVYSVNGRHLDNVKSMYGSGADLQIYHDGSDSYIQQTGTGDLIIENTTDDKDIKLKSDDGSGGTTEYLTVDGSQTRTLVSKNLDLLDNVRLRLGTGDAPDQQDLQIYHDGSNSYITDSGSGNLRIGGTQVDILNPDSNEFKARFKTDGSVELYHDNTKRFETTSSGIKVPTAGDGLQLVSPNGTVFTVTVDNSGNLSVT